MNWQRISKFAGTPISPQILQTAWHSYGTKLTLGAWGAFAGIHLGLSSSYVRPKMIELFDNSEQKYRMFYSSLLCGVLLPFTWKFHNLSPIQKGPVLLDRYVRRSGWKFTSFFLRTLGLLFISEAFMTPIKNPMGMDSYLENLEPSNPRDVSRKWQPYGLQRITRHSLFFGYSLFGLGSCMLARRSLCHLLLWGLVTPFSIVGALHQESRVRPGKPQLYFKETSRTPFLAYINGGYASSRMSTEIPPSAYSAAFCMFGAVFFFL